MKSHQSERDTQNRWLEIEEVRLVSDLRIMHAKVEELHYMVGNLRRRHVEDVIYKYADQSVLNQDIEQVDEIYGWFVGLKGLRHKRGA